MPNITKPAPIDESSDVVHDDTTGGTDGNPHTLSAELDDTGVLRAGQLPDLAVTNTTTVAAQSDLTSLDAEQGDVGIVTDDSQAYILTTDDPTVLGNWVVIKSPPAPVDDVFGRTGSVSPQSGVTTPRLRSPTLRRRRCRPSTPRSTRRRPRCRG